MRRSGVASCRGPCRWSRAAHGEGEKNSQRSPRIRSGHQAVEARGEQACSDSEEAEGTTLSLAESPLTPTEGNMWTVADPVLFFSLDKQTATGVEDTEIGGRTGTEETWLACTGDPRK